MSRPPGPSRLRARLSAALADWLPRQRWFAAKDRPVAAVRIEEYTEFGDPAGPAAPRGVLLVVGVDFADGGAREHYLVPIGLRDAVPDALRPTVLTVLDGLFVYDALADHELTSLIVRRIARGTRLGSISFRPEASVGADRLPRSRLPLPARALEVEQSNTSVVLDERYLLKVFRRIEPGVNQDLAVQRALQRMGSDHIPALLGSIESQGEGATGSWADGGAVVYGLLQEFVASASDGWAMALASVRDLLAAGAEPGQLGGDFSAESFRLGRMIAEVHADLGLAYGQGRLEAGQAAELAAEMERKLAAAQQVVPELGPHAEALRSVLAGVLTAGPGAPVQRVHGDLHLGQVLRGPGGWLVIDFEGEPAAAPAERAAARSPLRDIAGMLRSFDYAAHHQFTEPGHETEPDPLLLKRARQWSARNRAAFCEGYADRGTDPREHPALLRAFVAEKAVYEAVYEARSRPSWLPIPLAAVRRLADSASADPLTALDLAR
ncbi:hypothetical protein ACFO3J_00290 [Streptomyces polygonati]|uniref:Maltokinase n=1 Tax=Streptomyces polygonati TaxID=1617087 RepID=A0ABV8HD98_9ACTN